ncbi:LOW QUALITY PROTEIN: hypothetical protein ACHAWF_016612 [Thalassiosira exigua]
MEAGADQLAVRREGAPAAPASTSRASLVVVVVVRPRATGDEPPVAAVIAAFERERGVSLVLLAVRSLVVVRLLLAARPASPPPRPRQALQDVQRPFHLVSVALEPRPSRDPRRHAIRGTGAEGPARGGRRRHGRIRRRAGSRDEQGGPRDGPRRDDRRRGGRAPSSEVPRADVLGVGPTRRAALPRARRQHGPRDRRRRLRERGRQDVGLDRREGRRAIRLLARSPGSSRPERRRRGARRDRRGVVQPEEEALPAPPALWRSASRGASAPAVAVAAPSSGRDRAEGAPHQRGVVGERDDVGALVRRRLASRAPRSGVRGGRVPRPVRRGIVVGVARRVGVEDALQRPQQSVPMRRSAVVAEGRGRVEPVGPHVVDGRGEEGEGGVGPHRPPPGDDVVVVVAPTSVASGGAKPAHPREEEVARADAGVAARVVARLPGLAGRSGLSAGVADRADGSRAPPRRARVVRGVHRGQDRRDQFQREEAGRGGTGTSPARFAAASRPSAVVALAVQQARRQRGGSQSEEPVGRLPRGLPRRLGRSAAAAVLVLLLLLRRQLDANPRQERPELRHDLRRAFPPTARGEAVVRAPPQRPDRRDGRLPISFFRRGAIEVGEVEWGTGEWGAGGCAERSTAERRATRGAEESSSRESARDSGSNTPRVERRRIRTPRADAFGAGVELSTRRGPAGSTVDRAVAKVAGEARREPRTEARPLQDHRGAASAQVISKLGESRTVASHLPRTRLLCQWTSKTRRLEPFSATRSTASKVGIVAKAGLLAAHFHTIAELKRTSTAIAFLLGLRGSRPFGPRSTADPSLASVVAPPLGPSQRRAPR